LPVSADDDRESNQKQGEQFLHLLTLRTAKTCVEQKVAKRFCRGAISSGGHPACRIWRHLAARTAKPTML
jgi:hypothetical protein